MTREQLIHLSEVEKLLQELESMKKFDHGSKHFAFLEHYGDTARQIHVPSKFNDRLFVVVDEIIVELKEEIASA